MTAEKKITMAVVIIMAIQSVGFLIASAWKFASADFLAGAAALTLSLGFFWVTMIGRAIYRAENRRRKS
jgi:nitrogen fixation/metabolism regulation signal transduction histidine kinase